MLNRERVFVRVWFETVRRGESRRVFRYRTLGALQAPRRESAKENNGRGDCYCRGV